MDNDQAIISLLHTLLKTNSFDKIEASDEEKKSAAYALNMCTVSVSQIIDYNDLNIMEQEYDAILNNLNLEHIPKDEALLNILKRILDVITFFRKQDCEKKIIERDYQQKIKDAIWSAVPSISIFASGNPVTVAISLATQIGTGYMNYRRAKAANSLEYDQKNWELYETALEQFNTLRRELFDTAWRLADKYKFDDNYRLTERQITEYNNILMDPDPLCRYEKLDFIKDNFEAYPPFWYFFGHAAAQIAYDDKYKDNNICNTYLSYAIQHFEKYEDINKFNEKNLLREDELYSSCALEHVDLLLKQNKDTENKDTEKIKNLIKAAEKNSGGRNDIMELCAVAYLQIDDQEQAERVLRKLVNSDYNKTVNAQMLSKIYAKKFHNRPNNESEIAFQYKTLAQRCGGEKILYPLESDNEKVFESNQRSFLISSYDQILEAFLNKYYNKYLNIVINNPNIKELSEMFDAFLASVDKLPKTDNFILGNRIRDKIYYNNNNFKHFLEYCNDGKINDDKIFKDIVTDPFMKYVKKYRCYITDCQITEISKLDSIINDFALSEQLNYFLETNETDMAVYSETKPNFITLVYGDYDKNQYKLKKDEIVKNDTAKQNLFQRMYKKPSLYIQGENDFNKYVNNNVPLLKDKIIAILEGKPKDLIFMSAGIYLPDENRYCQYSHIDKKDDKLYIDQFEYSNDYVDIDKLKELIDKLNKNNNDQTPQFIKNIFIENN